MEIIISDDCSKDSSWDKLQKVVSQYHGEKTIILHRNETNLGMARNWCKLCSLARGELLFKGDGDDISLPDRVEKIVSDYLASGRKALLISHSYSHIDLEGNTIGHTILPISGDDTRSAQGIYEGHGFFHPGTGSAYHHSLYDKFGDISDEKAADDAVFVGRAVLLGAGTTPGLVRVVPGEFVKYRIGSGNTTFVKQYRKGMAKGLHYGYHTQCQLLMDIEKVKDELSKEQYSFFLRMFTRRKAHLESVLKLYEGKTFGERLIGYREAQNKRLFSVYHCLMWFLLLPPAIGDVILELMLFFRRRFC